MNLEKGSFLILILSILNNRKYLPISIKIVPLTGYKKKTYSRWLVYDETRCTFGKFFWVIFVTAANDGLLKKYLLEVLIKEGVGSTGEKKLRLYFGPILDGT